MIQFSLLYSNLILCIFLVVASGIGIGYVFPLLAHFIAYFQIDTASIPNTIGLILMMYRPLANVKYDEADLLQDWKVLLLLLMQGHIIRSSPHFTSYFGVNILRNKTMKICFIGI